jgi:hypothetical protein
VWHAKEPSLVKAVSAKHRPVTNNGDNCQIGDKIAEGVIYTNKQSISKQL